MSGSTEVHREGLVLVYQRWREIELSLDETDTAMLDQAVMLRSDSPYSVLQAPLQIRHPKTH
jgi:hypothetical protein